MPPHPPLLLITLTYPFLFVGLLQTVYWITLHVISLTATVGEFFHLTSLILSRAQQQRQILDYL